MMIKINDLVVVYGGIEVLKGISLEVLSGKIVILVGVNGVGKSIILKFIVGFVKFKSGSIDFEGIDLLKFNIEFMVKKGIVLVLEGRRVFVDFIVLENLKIGVYIRKDIKGIEEDLEKVYLLFLRLKERIW